MTTVPCTHFSPALLRWQTSKDELMLFIRPHSWHEALRSCDGLLTRPFPSKRGVPWDLDVNPGPDTTFPYRPSRVRNGLSLWQPATGQDGSTYISSFQRRP
ncbi:unnamed protein product [Symbiodinium natans]|uniref:Uncharacterized protein n=1 Tax=Symbiodinium natans TaxID=878477 RepID=A0A812NPN9_9DINO|nr:unnamed protein product [Symbiodinium natans]